MAEPELTPAEREERTQRLVFTAIVVATAVGLAASAALLVDYTRPIPLFCSEDGGCARLRHTVYAHMIFGLPTPAVGLAGYVVLGGLALARGQLARFLHLIAVTFGALFAGLLLYVQVSHATFCAYCLTVDITTIVLLSLVLLRVRTEADGPDLRGAGAVAAVFVMAAGLPFVTNALVKPRVPPVIAAEMKKTPPGKITIVDFIDFECPYCRQTADDFQPSLDKYRGRFRLVRKQMPLTRIHPHAADAARAAVCGETLGKGDEMANALIHAPLPALSDDGTTKIAVSLGLDEKAFRACLSSPETQQRIQSDEAEFKAAGGRGLPFIWIENIPIAGAQGPDKLRQAMDKAIGEIGG
jgi:predicted DsbA family dithiol-disulfide isomerase/uncharacterized membrane protein